MTFAVDLTALAEVPGMLGRLGADARASHDYVAEPYGGLDGPIPGLDRNRGAGLINFLDRNHARIRVEVLGFLSAVHAAAERRGGAVAEAYGCYLSIDREVAESLDRLLAPTELDPIVGRAQSLQPQWTQVRSLEPVRPTELLRPLTDHRAELPYEPSWSDALSPTSLGRDLVWYLTGLAAKLGLCDRARDPMDDLVIPMVGDWAGMQACGEALGHLAEATRALSTNAGWIALRVEGAWLGNAADACWDRLRRLELAVAQAPAVLGRMSAAYLGVCDEIRAAQELAEFAVSELLDWAAALGLAGLTAGVSLLVKLADNLSDLRGLVDKYEKALFVIDSAAHAVRHHDSVLSGLGLLSIEGGVDLPVVPA